MSDFLNQFSKDNYQDLIDESEKKREQKKKTARKEKKEQITEDKAEVFLEAAPQDKSDKADNQVVKKDKKKKKVDHKKSATELPEMKEYISEDDLVTDEELEELDVREEKNQTHASFLDLTSTDDDDSEDEDIDGSIDADEEEFEVATSRRDDFVEETEIDPTYHKRKMMRNGLIVLSVVLAFAGTFGLYFVMNRVTMPNFVDKNISEAKTWALKNRMELDLTEEYSLVQDKQVVITQSKTAQKKVSKGSVIEMKVSLGADPEELVDLSKVMSMNATLVEKMKKDQRLDNMKLLYEFDEKEPKGKLLEMKFKADSVNEKTYRRKDTVTIRISKGKEVFEKNIEVPNFKGKDLAEVETWTSKNMITLETEKAASDVVPEGMVISQSVDAGSKVAKKSEFKIVISQGKGAVVPYFGNMTKSEAESYTAEGIQVILREEYSSNVGYGYFIGQSIPSGAMLVGDDDRTLIVTYSAGRPYIDDLAAEGKSEKDLAPYFFDFQSKGANISYTVSYENNASVPKGTVIRTNKYSQYLGMSDSVHVVISLG